MRERSQELRLKKLRLQRILAGMTQADLAKKLGVTQRAVSHWELGTAGISREHWRALIKIFPELKGMDNE
jgi:putative transcriptional regulator